MIFRRGYSYLAGFDEPFVVSRDRLTKELRTLGFDVLAVDDCEKWGRVPFPTPSRCGDGWDAIAYVLRTSPDGEHELPDRVKWIREFGMPQPVRAIPLHIAGENCADAERWCGQLGQELGGCHGGYFHCTNPLDPQPPPQKNSAAWKWGAAGAAVGAVALLAYYSS